jgi:hypothetical protein
MLPFLCANDSPALASGLLARRSDARERLEPVGDSPGDGDGLLRPAGVTVRRLGLTADHSLRPLDANSRRRGRLRSLGQVSNRRQPDEVAEGR